MITHTVLNKEQKEALVKASQASGLSHSSFLRVAAIEKINRMGIQIKTSQGTNLDSPKAQPHVNAGEPHDRI